MIGVVYAILSLISVDCSCADLMTWYWSAMRIRSVENFDLAPNVDIREKWMVSAVGGRSWWPKQVTTAGVGSRGGGEGGVDSKARGREMTGGSKLFNHRSDFQRNIIIRLRCFNGNSIIDDNLKWGLDSWQQHALSCGTNFEKVIFSVLAFYCYQTFLWLR